MVIVLIAAGIALVVTLVVVGYKRNQARLQAIQQLCLSKGWQYTARDPFGLPHRWSGTPFNVGDDRTARNVVTGEVGGRPMISFDYSYTTESRDSEGRTSTTTHHCAIYALGMPCALPELHLGPEGVFSRIGKAVGMQDIELESEEFNRRYRVRCPDPKLATDVLSPRTMEMLIAAPKMRFRFAGTDLVCYENGCISAVEILNRTAVLARVLDGVPAFVWKDRGLGELRPAANPGSNA
jgi:hypothetical protein